LTFLHWRGQPANPARFIWKWPL